MKLHGHGEESLQQRVMQLLCDARAFGEPLFVRRRPTCARLSRHSHCGAGNANGDAHGARGLVTRRDHFASQLVVAGAVEYNVPTVDSMRKTVVTDLHVASCLPETKATRDFCRGLRGHRSVERSSTFGSAEVKLYGSEPVRIGVGDATA